MFYREHNKWERLKRYWEFSMAVLGSLHILFFVLRIKHLTCTTRCMTRRLPQALAGLLATIDKTKIVSFIITFTASTLGYTKTKKDKPLCRRLRAD